MPQLRQAFVPPMSGRRPDELRTYIDGINPVSGNPFGTDVIDGLTAPLTEGDRSAVSYQHQRQRLLEPATEDELQELFLDNGWVDVPPIVLPTPERVEAMLRGTSHPADEVVGKIRAASMREDWEFTVEQVAINAVMAGAKPEYFPVILALLASGYTARHSSISSMSSMVLINGPVRSEIGMNSGIGALGPYSRANTTIGRAYGLASQNLQGGSVPGLSYMGTQGNPHAFHSMTFAENEEDSPWEPYHVQHGFAREESTATIFVCARSFISGGGVGQFWRDHVTETMTGLRASGGVVLLLDPLAAAALVGHEGFVDKAALSGWLADHARIPAQRWWGQGLQDLFFGPRARAGVEPWASYLAADPQDPIPLNVPEDIHVVVVGGKTTAAWSIAEGVANGPERERRHSGVTVRIDPWR